MKILQQVTVTQNTITLNGRKLPTEDTGMKMIRNIYRERIGEYPRFFKMDNLGKLGFAASELLLQQEEPRTFNEKGRVIEEEGREDRAVIFFNKNSSANDDHHYQSTIEPPGNFFPSPGIFVYTLPNIVIGEISIRNRYYGDSNFYILSQKDENRMDQILEEAFLDETTTSILCGWLDVSADGDLDADLKIITK